MTNQIRCGLQWKLDKTMTWPIAQVQFMPKKKLSCHDRSDQVRSVMKTKNDNNVTDPTRVAYAENKMELSRPIGLGVYCDKS